MHVQSAYDEWGAGIADMIIHAPSRDTLVEYLAVLESQVGVPVSATTDRVQWAASLEAAVFAEEG
jgi:hypothetical protein